MNLHIEKMRNFSLQLFRQRPPQLKTGSFTPSSVASRMLALVLLSTSRRSAPHLLPLVARLAPPSTARLIARSSSSATAAAASPAGAAQPLQWSRAASDTVVTSARPLTPSDASHDGIAKVRVARSAFVPPLTCGSGWLHPLLD